VRLPYRANDGWTWPREVAICRQLLPRLLEVAPNALLVIVTNPVDVVTYAALKILAHKRLYHAAQRLPHRVSVPVPPSQRHDLEQGDP
jgi:hypothetical protein